MKPINFLVLLVLLAACKKEHTNPSKPAVYTEPDFALIPTKDAKWYVHTLGNNYYSFGDTALHVYTVVEALGKDTVIEGYIYHVYSRKVDVRNSLDTTYNSFYRKYYSRPQRIYLIEDTLAKKVYNGYDKYFNEFSVLLDFSDSANSGQTRPYYGWPNMNIVKSGYVVAGQKLQAWDMQNAYDNKYQYFYKAIGIGSATGILPDNFGPVLSLDFVYKGDSIHFDYPLQ